MINRWIPNPITSYTWLLLYSRVVISNLTNFLFTQFVMHTLYNQVFSLQQYPVDSEIQIWSQRLSLIVYCLPILLLENSFRILKRNLCMWHFSKILACQIIVGNLFLNISLCLHKKMYFRQSIKIHWDKFKTCLRFWNKLIWII